MGESASVPNAVTRDLKDASGVTSVD